jgi:hypothetical protein
MSSIACIPGIVAALAVLDSHQRDRKGPTLLAAARDLLQAQADTASRILDLIDEQSSLRDGLPVTDSDYQQADGRVEGLRCALNGFLNPTPTP